MWHGDSTFEEYELDGDGLIHVLHCANCDAVVFYYLKDSNEFAKQED